MIIIDLEKIIIEYMKTVGLLAYHQACNFGANLQIFSTYSSEEFDEIINILNNYNIENVGVRALD